MKYLIYMSASTHLFTDAELKEILTKSRQNNAAHLLTGMLLYSEGSFVQVLEGDATALDHTYKKIKRDKRHKNLIELAEGELAERIFPFWSMGFKAASPDEFSKLENYINPAESDVWRKDSQHPALTVLKTFAESNRL